MRSKIPHSILLSTPVLLSVYSPTLFATDSHIYASIRLSAQLQDTGDDFQAELVDNASRLGFSVQHRFGNAMTAVGVYEIGVKADQAKFGAGETNRLSYLGLEHGKAGLYLGTQWSPYYQIVGQATDQFNALGAKQIHTVGRLDNLIKFAGTYGNTRIETAIVIENNDRESSNRFMLDPVSGDIIQQNNPGYDDDDYVDRLQLAAAFNIGAFTIGVGLDRLAESVNGSEKGEIFGLAARYEGMTTQLAVSFHNQDKELLDSSWSGDHALRQIEMYGAYRVDERNSYHGVFGQSDDSQRTTETLTFGYERTLSEQLKLWVEAEYTDPDLKGQDKIILIAAGARIDWE